MFLERKYLDKNVIQFWEDWIKANPMKRLKIIKTLPICDRFKVKIGAEGELNSYFEDLFDLMVMRNNIEKTQRRRI